MTLVGACAKTDRDAPRYYYPAEELTGGLVYGYAPVEPLGGVPHYWYFRSVETADSTTLVSTYYDAAFEPRQLVRERLVAQGSLLRDLRLYFPTPSGESAAVQADVLQPALFSFEAPDEDRLLVSAVAFTEPELDGGATPVVGSEGGGNGASGSEGSDGEGSDGEGIGSERSEGGGDGGGEGGVTGFSESENQPSQSRARYTLTRNRSYVRDTTYILDGAPVPAQLWQVRELMEQDSAGVLAIESDAIEIYARDIGLVYRERRFPNGEGEAYRLAERITMDSLNVRAANAAAAAPE